ncbi:hypothetical protein [Rhizobium sp. RU36D]|uniref:hypothetical protein n=1 Tax=Rhizobium sp. RU36D TaxID=1907415 RepID=UPI0009D7C80A|nr:hypothetical protein [Rhizobium sp. RU36D]SMD18629.1 hypothetical protein SAMN05880593_13554 [Rhizobium sp. RU36D]
MATMTKDITIDFATPEFRPAGVQKWLDKVGLNPADLPDLTFTATINFGSDDIEDEDLSEWYEACFSDAGSWLERVNRYLAENNCAAAMDELEREFGGAPPVPHHCRRQPHIRQEMSLC